MANGYSTPVQQFQYRRSKVRDECFVVLHQCKHSFVSDITYRVS